MASSLLVSKEILLSIARLGYVTEYNPHLDDYCLVYRPFLASTSVSPARSAHSSPPISDGEKSQKKKRRVRKRKSKPSKSPAQEVITTSVQKPSVRVWKPKQKKEVLYATPAFARKFLFPIGHTPNDEEVNEKVIEANLRMGPVERPKVLIQEIESRPAPEVDSISDAPIPVEQKSDPLPEESTPLAVETSSMSPEIQEIEECGEIEEEASSEPPLHYDFNAANKLFREELRQSNLDAYKKAIANKPRATTFRVLTQGGRLITNAEIRSAIGPLDQWSTDALSDAECNFIRNSFSDQLEECFSISHDKFQLHHVGCFKPDVRCPGTSVFKNIIELVRSKNLK